MSTIGRAVFPCFLMLGVAASARTALAAPSSVGDKIASDVSWVAGDSPYSIVHTVSNFPADKSWKISVEPGVEVRGPGTLHLTGSATIEIAGEAARPVKFKDVTFDFHRGSALSARYAVFDHCTFQKHPRSSGIKHYSTRWRFDQCTLNQCSFPSLKISDCGVRLTDCMLNGMSLPEIIAGSSDDPMKYLRTEWDTIDHCRLEQCTVWPSAFWCARNSNFLRCHFEKGAAFESDTATDVVAYVADTDGDSPDKIVAADPPTRAALRINYAHTPFPVFSFSGSAPAASATPGTLQPVPDAASQAAALKVLKELFKPFPPVRPEDKASVAKKLMEQAAASDNDPVTQYVVLHQAAELSAGIGDVETAMHAVDELGKRFRIDAGAEKLLILNRARNLHLNATAASTLADAALRLGWDAMRGGDFDAASRAATLASAVVRETQDVKLTLAAQTLATDARRAQGEAARAKAAEEKLKSTPGDPAANLTAGRFLCFWRGDWARGLPLLAQSADAAIKAMAAEELSGPTEAPAEFALAEKWLALSSKETGTPRNLIRRHASIWYQQAQAGLAGLQKSLAEKRVAELQESAAQPASFASHEKENALTKLLNDPAHWTVKRGKWNNVPGKLHGEGDSEIWFDTPVPRDIVLSFHINVIKGIRPRMFFEGTDMKFANEGNTQTLYPHGTNLTVKKEGFPYQNNQPHLLRFKLSGNHFEIEMDQKPAFAGTYKATPEPLRLRFHAGDSFSPGITEFWGFEVESLPKPAGEK